MSASTVFCYVLPGDVGVVADLNGQVTNVVCPEFIRLNHMCTRKAQERSSAGTLLGAAAIVLSDRTLGTRMAFCEFSKPHRVISSLLKSKQDNEQK